MHEQPRREGAHGERARPALAPSVSWSPAEPGMPAVRSSCSPLPSPGGGAAQVPGQRPPEGSGAKAECRRGLQLPAGPAPRMRAVRPDGAMAAAEAPVVLQQCGCKGIRTCLICEGQRCGDPPWQLSPQVRAGRGATQMDYVLHMGKLRPNSALMRAGVGACQGPPR